MLSAFSDLPKSLLGYFIFMDELSFRNGKWSLSFERGP